MKNLDLLVPQPPEPRDEFRFGTVTQANPLMVQFDGDTVSTPVATALEPVRVGERVLVLAKKQQRIVVGVIGGTPAANLDLSKLLTTAGGTITGTLDVAGTLLEGGLTIDRLYGAGVTRYDHQYGYLIQTNLPAAGSHMWELDVRFNTYSMATLDGTGWLWLQGYSYEVTNSIINSAGRSTIGPRQSRAFNYNGFLCFWIAPGDRYETAHFYLRNSVGSNNPAIINLVDSGLPTGRTREAVIDVQTIGYETPWAELPTTGASSFTRYDPVQYKRVDKQVFIRGGIQRDSYGGWTENVTYTVGTLPVGFRPAFQTALTVFSDPARSSTPPVMAVAFADGRIDVKASGTANYWAVLGGSFLTV